MKALMKAILAGPVELRWTLLFVLGLCVGAAANWAVYALAWHSRPISPWQRPHPAAPRRHWFDFVPIFGWPGLVRESSIHGRGFWIRPMLIELACGVGLPALYQWETTRRLAPPIAGIVDASDVVLHMQFASHAILMAFMLVATFIDFDEKTIPDGVTIPGTLIGLLLPAVWPDSHLPVVRVMGLVEIKKYDPLLLTSTDAWPAWLDEWRGAALGVGIFVAWCLVLAVPPLRVHHGWGQGVLIWLRKIRRDRLWFAMMMGLAALGTIGILAVWSRGGAAWPALITSLVGLAGGGGLIWAVRIIGKAALHKEAMGFGDVTLMAMIGAFLGWQACLVIFFFSPFVALVVAVAQWAATGRRDLPYGPYLCLAALVVIVEWASIWEWLHETFQMGWFLPAILAVCLALLMGLLMLWRILEQSLYSR